MGFVATLTYNDLVELLSPALANVVHVRGDLLQHIHSGSENTKIEN